MKVYELIENVELQSEYKIVRYDYDDGYRIPLDYEDVSGKEIRYMYCEDGVIYIEVEEEY